MSSFSSRERNYNGDRSDQMRRDGQRRQQRHSSREDQRERKKVEREERRSRGASKEHRPRSRKKKREEWESQAHRKAKLSKEDREALREWRSKYGQSSLDQGEEVKGGEAETAEKASTPEMSGENGSKTKTEETKQHSRDSCAAALVDPTKFYFDSQKKKYFRIVKKAHAAVPGSQMEALTLKELRRKDQQRQRDRSYAEVIEWTSQRLKRQRPKMATVVGRWPVTAQPSMATSVLRQREIAGGQRGLRAVSFVDRLSAYLQCLPSRTKATTAKVSRVVDHRIAPTSRPARAMCMFPKPLANSSELCSPFEHCTLLHPARHMICVYDISKGRAMLRQEVFAHDNIRGMDAIESPDGRTSIVAIVSASRENNCDDLVLYSTSEEDPVLRTSPQVQVRCWDSRTMVRVSTLKRSEATKVWIGGSGRTYLCAMDRLNAPSVFRLVERKRGRRLPEVTSIEPLEHKDGGVAAVALQNGSIYRLDPRQPRAVMLHREPLKVGCIKTTMEGDSLVYSALGSSLGVIDLRMQRVRLRFEGHHCEGAEASDISLWNNNIVATVGDRRELQMWDLGSGAPLSCRSPVFGEDVVMLADTLCCSFKDRRSHTYVCMSASLYEVAIASSSAAECTTFKHHSTI